MAVVEALCQLCPLLLQPIQFSDWFQEEMRNICYVWWKGRKDWLSEPSFPRLFLFLFVSVSLVSKKVIWLSCGLFCEFIEPQLYFSFWRSLWLTRKLAGRLTPDVRKMGSSRVSAWDWKVAPAVGGQRVAQACTHWRSLSGHVTLVSCCFYLPLWLPLCLELYTLHLHQTSLSPANMLLG